VRPDNADLFHDAHGRFVHCVYIIVGQEFQWFHEFSSIDSSLVVE
jgi:hypothetical protein